MYYVYVLKSDVVKKFYTGFTNNIKARLIDHNKGKSVYSNRHRPWTVAYLEKYQDKKEAVAREKYLKSAAGRRWLKKTVNN